VILTSLQFRLQRMGMVRSGIFSSRGERQLSKYYKEAGETRPAVGENKLKRLKGEL
jgi:hypothetical protein